MGHPTLIAGAQCSKVRPAGLFGLFRRPRCLEAWLLCCSAAGVSLPLQLHTPTHSHPSTSVSADRILSSRLGAAAVHHHHNMHALDPRASPHLPSHLTETPVDLMHVLYGYTLAGQGLVVIRMRSPQLEEALPSDCTRQYRR